MASEKLPYWRVFPGDYAKDLNLRTCSRPARSVWFEMMNLMHDSEERGVLVLCGKPLTDEEIAVAVGGNLSETLNCIHELLDKGVFSRRKNGAIYSRRMVREEERRKVNQRNGSLGGNPKLVNQSDKPPVKRTPNQNPEIENEDPRVEEVSKGNGSGGVGDFNPSQLPKQSKDAKALLERLRKAVDPVLVWAEDAAKFPSTQSKLLARVKKWGEPAYTVALKKAFTDTGDRSIAMLLKAADKQFDGKQTENFSEERYAGIGKGDGSF